MMILILIVNLMDILSRTSKVNSSGRQRIDCLYKFYGLSHQMYRIVYIKHFPLTVHPRMNQACRA